MFPGQYFEQKYYYSESSSELLGKIQFKVRGGYTRSCKHAPGRFAIVRKYIILCTGKVFTLRI